MNTWLRELIVLHFLNDGARTTFIVLLPFIAKDLSIPLSLVGILGSSQNVMAMLLALPTGFIAGRVGGSRLVVMLLGLYAASILGIAFFPYIAVVFLLYFLAAIGFGMFHPVGFIVTATFAKERAIGRAMGDFTAIGEIGRVALPPIMLFLTALLGWRLSMGFLGMVAFSCFLFFLIVMPRKDTHETPSQESYKDFLRHILELFSNKRSIAIMLSGVLDNFASTPVNIFLPFLLLAKGITPTQLSMIMGGYFICSLIGKSILGRGVDRFGNKRVFVLSEWSMGAIVLLLTFATQFWVLAVLASLLGMFTRGTIPVIQTMFSELAGKEHYHKVFAGTETLIHTAGVITTVSMGIVAEKFGIHSVFLFASIVAVAATLPLFTLRKVS